MKRFFYKILKFVVIFILILVAIYISFGFISGGFKATITRSVSIDARPLAVWSVLTDFEKYPDWNPFLRISGTQYQAGKKIQVTLLDSHGKESETFSPKLLTYSCPDAIIWKDSLLFGSIFDRRHQFYLEIQNDGTTLFTQTEDFSGFLVPLARLTTFKETEKQFSNMNSALKVHAEMLQ
ncbi:MAG: SRPBCC domain-containing protein [Eubacteriaceae bacterium]|jgi:hypothetical protein|nr:SRPBCC domain-containing protein [Eubacteriaceae bacterium]